MVEYISDSKSIRARCPGCDGAFSIYYPLTGLDGLPSAAQRVDEGVIIVHNLYKCSGCGRGGLGGLYIGESEVDFRGIDYFYPESGERLPIPKSVPEGIRNEFHEAEKCLDNKCFRAAGALFRSVLDKTLRAGGYKIDRNTNLDKQINCAANDGIITSQRRERAHAEIRVLGNDILHEEYVEKTAEDIELSHHYCQRILEDFYDNRESVIKTLRNKKRVPEEDEADTPT